MAITNKNSYITDPEKPLPLISRIFPVSAIGLYPKILRIIWTSNRRVLKGVYNADDWASSSLDILRALENFGVRFEITGMDNLRELETPAVFIGNHMSTLETFILPGIIQPIKPVTFVVKKSLVNTPVFGPIMQTRGPLVVGRTNPREDLKAVITEGTKIIGQGASIVIFPQSTRSIFFKPEEFNSLGIKLALKTGAPVVPLALKTDAWGAGKIIKDLGPVDRNKKVFFAFGRPLEVKGRGAEEHRQVIAFIQNRLAIWEREDESQK